MRSMGRWERSKQLVKTSWGVLKQDPELLWLTVWAAVFAMVGLLIGGLIALFGGMAAASGSEVWWVANQGVLFLAGLVAALLAGISNVFFHGALVHGALDRLKGKDPTTRTAIAGARGRFGQLAGWAVVSVIFAMIMQAIRERGGFIAGLFTWMAEAVWAVISFLVLPIIIVEGTGPFASLKRSTQLLKKTWGENLIGQFGLGLVGFVAALPGIFVGLLLIWAGSAAGIAALIWIGIVLAVLWAIAVSLFFSALKSVYQAVLYRYATENEVSEGFEDIGIDQAFVSKPGRGGFGRNRRSRGSTWGESWN